MKLFRRLYYKIVTLFCIISMFVILFSADNVGTGKGCFCVLTGLLCFGSWSIGKETIDPDKPIRNIFKLLLWSLLGFGIMSIGISCLINDVENNSVTIMFLVFAAFGLIISYIISIIKNKDWYAILSVVLFVVGCVVAGISNGIFIVGLLSLFIFAAAIVCLILSMIKGPEED